MPLSYENYTGDNTTTQFSIPFTYQAESEISVTVDGVAETGLTFPSSSTVQLTSAPATGTLVQVRRTTDLATRAVDFASGSVLTEEDLDNSSIQTFHAAQEAIDKTNDGMTLGSDDKWDSQNKIIKSVGTPTATTDAATKAYVDGVAGSASAAAASASAAASSATAAATSATAASTSATNAGTSATTASTGATTATTQATAAAASAAAALVSENNAATSATTATTQAATATTQAGVATTQATNAATSATAAQAAQAAAELAADNFDDTYLGAKSSDPTVDNDGDALNAGDLYFNTTSNVLKVYSGSAWQVAAVSTSGLLAAANDLSDLNDAPTALTNLGLTATAAELNTLSGITSDVTELNYNDITTLGLVEASKTVTADANAEITIPYDKKLYFGTDQDAHIRYDENTTDTLIVDGAKVKFGQAVRGNNFSSNISGSTTLSFANYQNFIVTLTGNVTLSNPTTETTGQTGFIVFIQDSTGGYTVSLGTDYETAGGAGLTLSTTADAYDVVPYIVKANGSILLGTPQLAFA